MLSRCLAALVTLALSCVDEPARAREPAHPALRIGVYMDDGWRQAATGPARLSAALAAATPTLSPALRNETVFIGMRPWEGQRTGTTGNLLDALEQALTAQPWPETDLTLLLVSTPPARGSTPTEWAFATVGRPMGVIRSLRAHRSPDDPEGLARAEALQVVRVLARVVGAMPACSAAWMWQDLVTWPAGDENIPLPYPDELQTMSAVRSALGPSLRGALDPVLAQRLLADVQAIPASARRCQPSVFGAHERVLEALSVPQPEPTPIVNDVGCPSPSEHRSVRCVGLDLAQRGLDSEAIRWLRAALDERPEDAEVRLTLARALGRSGDDSAALALLEAHVIARPLEVRAWLNLGVAAARVGRVDRDRFAWSRVLRLEPGHTDAAALLESLGTIPTVLPPPMNP